MTKVVDKAHIKDIDFRSREVRQAQAIPEFKKWYLELAAQPHSDRIAGQLTMLSAVLWYLLPKNEYKKLVTSKRLLSDTVEDSEYEINKQLDWIMQED